MLAGSIPLTSTSGGPAIGPRKIPNKNGANDPLTFPTFPFSAHQQGPKAVLSMFTGLLSLSFNQGVPGSIPGRPTKNPNKTGL
jgi:hypothetical protein